MGRVEDAAGGGFVDELQGCGLAPADLVTQVQAQAGDQDVGISRGKEADGGRVYSFRVVDVGVDVIGCVVCGATAAAWGLHGAVARLATNYDCAYAGFVVHHFHEQGTCR